MLSYKTSSSHHQDKIKLLFQAEYEAHDANAATE